jgi:predicted nucleic acid-binding protein
MEFFPTALWTLRRIAHDERLFVDSSVVAKWILPEADSANARRLITDYAMRGDRLFVLDLCFAEVANAIWKRQHRRMIAAAESLSLLHQLLETPVQIHPSIHLLDSAMKIAATHARSVYDALFVALADDLRVTGITADEPLWQAVRSDFPNVVLLRDF